MFTPSPQPAVCHPSPATWNPGSRSTAKSQRGEESGGHAELRAPSQWGNSPSNATPNARLLARKQQLVRYKREQAERAVLARQREHEAEIRLATERGLNRQLHNVWQAQEWAKTEIERAKAEAELAARKEKKKKKGQGSTAG